MSTKMTPQLRFPEFTDKWQVEKLGDIAEFSKGSSISKNDIHEDGKIEAIRYGELYTTYTEVINEVQSRTNLSPNGLKFSKANDVIVPASGETAIDIATASCVLRDNIALSGDLNIIRTQNNGVFMAYYLNNKKKTDIARLAQGVSVIHLYSSNLKDLEVDLPSKPEQEKIADFLTAVDERIAVGEKKLELLETYKRGVMQKIFSQKIRFKDENGNEYPEWEEKKLGDSIEKNKKRNKNLAVNYVQSVSNKHGFVSQDEYFDGANIASKNTSNYFVIEKGTFAYNPSRINVGSLAYKTDTETSIVSPLYVSFKTKNDLENKFLLPWFSTLSFTKQMHRAFEGSVRDTLSYEALSGMKIAVPCKEEQQKIATFLATLDEKITVEKSKLAAARKFKKALLQRMFV